MQVSNHDRKKPKFGGFHRIRRHDNGAIFAMAKD
jgi:hypothetical protein